MIEFAVLTAASVVALLIFRPQPQRDAAAAQAWSQFHRYATAN